ncbi:MAG: Uma2 family endonuclease [Gemmatimonadaceae bacterium]
MPAESAAAVVWTREYVLDLMERSPTHWPRYELVDGALIVTPAPAPRHQVMQGELFIRLKAYADRHDLGHVMLAPADISLDPPRKSLLQPDVFVVPAGGIWPPKVWRDVASLRLAVEVLSPSTRRYDRGVKREYYLRHGVPEVWLVNLDKRLIERWRPGGALPELLRDVATWAPEPSLPPLRIELPALFDEALGTG